MNEFERHENLSSLLKSNHSQALRIESLMAKNVAIVGSGIAGLSLAHELSSLGIHSVLIDRHPLPGGNAARYACKATDSCQRCGACAVQDYVSKIAASDKVQLSLNSEVVNAQRSASSFEIQLFQTPQYVDHSRCNGCGICKKVCPSPNAILVDPFTGRFFINYQECSRSQNMACLICEQACPEQTIDVSLTACYRNLDVDAVVLASGFEPFDARVKTRFGYGRIPGVLSAMDLEDKLRRGYFDMLEEDRRPSSIAFIQCVGSRDVKIGRNYCSRVCCGYAMRSARLLKFKFPGINISMFYMDLQTFDRDFESRIAEAAKEVRLIRAIPSEVRTVSAGNPEVIYNDSNDEVMIEEFDFVVLSVGMGQNPRTIPGVFESVTNSGIYGGSDFARNHSEAHGVFITGAALGPKSIQESIENSANVALKIDSYLGNSLNGVDID